jgi:hypothetical protein
VKHAVTPDGRYFVISGRLWHMANSDLEEAERADFVGRLMAARRAVRDAKKRADREAEAAGKAKIATMGMLCGGLTERYGPDASSLAARRLTDFIVRGMKAQNWGRIVNISGALVAPKLNGAAPAKAALVSWSRTLSSELGAHGITVNTIAPGRINSAQVQKLHPAEQSKAEFIKQNIPAGYFGEPYDTGHLVTFLASPLARYINGAAIPVDGGAVRRVQDRREHPNPIRHIAVRILPPQPTTRSTGRSRRAPPHFIGVLRVCPKSPVS